MNDILIKNKKKFFNSEMEVAISYIVDNNKDNLWKEIKKLVYKPSFYLFYHTLVNMNINFVKIKECKQFYRKFIIDMLKNKNYKISKNQYIDNFLIGSDTLSNIINEYNISNKIINRLIKKYKILTEIDRNDLILTEFNTGINTGINTRINFFFFYFFLGFAIFSTISFFALNIIISVY